MFLWTGLDLVYKLDLGVLVDCEDFEKIRTNTVMLLRPDLDERKDVFTFIWVVTLCQSLKITIVLSTIDETLLFEGKVLFCSFVYQDFYAVLLTNESVVIHEEIDALLRGTVAHILLI